MDVSIVLIATANPDEGAVSRAPRGASTAYLSDIEI
jgi:hypothetical protein